MTAETSLVAFYDIQPGKEMGLFLQPRGSRTGRILSYRVR